MAPAETRIEIKKDCQNIEKRMPLMERNLGVGLNGCRSRWVAVMTFCCSVRVLKRGQRAELTFPKENERIQCDRDADVVNDSQIGVGVVSLESALGVAAGGFKNHRYKSQDRLDLGVLENTALDGEEGEGIRHVYGWQAAIEGEGVRCGRSTS